MTKVVFNLGKWRPRKDQRSWWCNFHYHLKWYKKVKQLFLSQVSKAVGRYFDRRKSLSNVAITVSRKFSVWDWINFCNWLVKKVSIMLSTLGKNKIKKLIFRLAWIRWPKKWLWTKAIFWFSVCENKMTTACWHISHNNLIWWHPPTKVYEFHLYCFFYFAKLSTDTPYML